MGGSVPFHTALEERLKLFEPSEQGVRACLENHPLEITRGMKELVDSLESRGTAVYFVSGGFRQMIYPIADLLGVERANVFANDLLFDSNGAYAGFDVNEPTSRAGGKAKVVQMLKEKHEVIVMIGDGATDMEARPPADAFIGYGGVAVREAVEKGADWFVKDFDDLLVVLKEDV